MSAFRSAALVLIASAMIAVEVSAESFEDCATACDGSGADTDGDGLDLCLESCLGTSDELMDSDADGMADSFEYAHGLDPLADDGGADADGDDMTNLDEYMKNSSASDPSSPYAMYFVAGGGSDEGGLGTSAYPWRTIGFALAQISSAGEPSRIVVEAGDYVEDIALKPEVMVSGARGASVAIIGQVTGASGAALENLALEPQPGQAVLFDMDDVAMALSGVRFVGSAERNVTGILMDGDAPASSLIDRCTFTSLGVGIDIGGAHPSIRRSTFSNIPAEFGEPLRPGAGIIIRAYDTKHLIEKSMGDERDPGEGWNDFMASIEGFAVINEREEVMAMQSNYWGTTDPALFPTRVSGNAVVLPVLAQSSAILASSVFCTVWDGIDQKRIGSAALSLTISTFDDVTENEDGIYAFPVVSEGAYNLTVNAPGYNEQQIPLELAGGELKSVTIALRPTAPAGNGSGGEDAAKGCALVAGGNAQAQQSASGELMLGALVIAAMTAARRRKHRMN